jgi:hypothetical protein
MEDPKDVGIYLINSNEENEECGKSRGLASGLQNWRKVTTT